MNKAKGDSAVIRQWELLRLLPIRGAGTTAKDLARQYAELKGELFGGNTPADAALLRKIQRDLATLETIGLISCNDKSKPFGWHLNGQQAYFAHITEAEALFMALTEKTITPLLPPSLHAPLAPVFERARSILNQNAGIKPPLRNRIIHSSVLPLIPPELDPAILSAVHQAMATNKMLHVEYQAAYRSEPRAMDLHIWGLFQNAPTTYMVAQKDGTTERRIFALHRIKQARVMTLSAEIPSDFNIETLQQEGELHFGSEGAEQLKLRVNKPLATILEQTPLSTDQQLMEEPKPAWPEETTFLLTATANLTWGLRFWLLSQGASLEVIEPQKLRNSIAREMQKGATRYSDSPTLS